MDEIRYQRVPVTRPPHVMVHRPPVTVVVATTRVPAEIVTRSRAAVEALVRRLAAHFAWRVVAARAGVGPDPRAAVSTSVTAMRSATRAARA